MAEINIPGISNKYKTNDYIDALIKKERIPLTREQEALDRYKEQQSAWRGVNQKMSELRESTKALYSYDNPFNNKLASSSNENAVTAEAGREAAFGQIKIDVNRPFYIKRTGKERHRSPGNLYISGWRKVRFL